MPGFIPGTFLSAIRSNSDMLSFEQINKSYGATRAVNGVTLRAPPGTVLGLVGENGAGKSTLIKIASGAIAPDSGRLLLEGQHIAPRNTNAAIAHGISSVFQELTLIRELTVEQNLLLTNLPLTLWYGVDRKQMRQTAGKILKQYRLEIDPGARVGSLPLGQQQMIEIIRAVERHPRVLLLDEATSALGGREVEWLADLVTSLRAKNTIILFISHRWDEIVRFCNSVAVLRNGELVHVAKTSDLTEDEVVRLMTGRESGEVSFPSRREPQKDIVLSGKNLQSPTLRGVDFDLKKGEILGLGGLVGQGQGSLLEVIFGAEALSQGSIAVAGKFFTDPTPKCAIASGIAYVPQERKTEGLLLDKSISTNVTLAVLQQLRSFLGAIDVRSEAASVDEAITRMQIRTPSAATPIGHLSGGNQQKALLEKWLLTNPSILLLNDVTRGVDVATKRQIYAIIADIAAQGVGVIWYSTDARELVGLAHRVLVLLQGRINAELRGKDVAVDRIIRASVIDYSPADRRSNALPAL
jgi:ribose transport system ATP-binding protein